MTAFEPYCVLFSRININIGRKNVSFEGEKMSFLRYAYSTDTHTQGKLKLISSQILLFKQKKIIRMRRNLINVVYRYQSEEIFLAALSSTNFCGYLK